MPHREHSHIVPGRDPYTGQGAFRFWCQKVLPLVYDDSLSYMELLCKVVTYLNNVISDVATVENNVDELYSAFAQLQDYVNTYFDDLDLTEEVRKILDEMAESGQLDELLDPLVIEHLPGLVENDLPGVVAEQLPGAVSDALPAVVAEQLPEVVETDLPGVVTSQLPGVVETQLPGVVESALPDVVETQLPGVVETDLPGVVTSQLPGVVTSQLPGVVGQQLPGVVGNQLPAVVASALPDVVETQLPDIVETQLPDVAGPIIHEDLPDIVEEKFPGEIADIINDIFPVPTSSDEGLVPTADNTGHYFLDTKGLVMSEGWEAAITGLGELGNPKLIYGDDSVVVAYNNAAIWYTVDNGKNWVNSELVATWPCFCVKYGSSLLISTYTGGRYTCYRVSTDFQTTKTYQTSPESNTGVARMAYKSEYKGGYYLLRGNNGNTKLGTDFSGGSSQDAGYDWVTAAGGKFYLGSGKRVYEEEVDSRTQILAASKNISLGLALNGQLILITGLSGDPVTGRGKVNVISNSALEEIGVLGAADLTVNRDDILYNGTTITVTGVDTNGTVKTYKSYDGVSWTLIATGATNGAVQTSANKVKIDSTGAYYSEKGVYQNGVNVTDELKELLGIE